jgi:hypothetical protein
MAGHPRVTAWTTLIQAPWPPVTTPHATVLALGSLGLGLARSWALTAVSAFLAPWLGRNAPAVRQQGRECCSEATATRGTARGALAGAPCLVPLWPWVGEQWEGTPLAVALAATTLGTRVTVLAMSGVSRSWASPGAWTVRAATAHQAWQRAGLRRRRQVRRAVPRAWTVLVRAERGLSARWRVRRLTRVGGHPCWRRTWPGGPVRPPGQVRGGALQTLVPEPGTPWQGTGSACHGRPRQLHGTRLACGDAEDQAPWGLLPALPPEARTACGDGGRTWMAQGCKSTPRAGWPWQRPPMPTPARAARRWRAGAGAPLGVLSGGGEADAAIPARTPAAGECLSPRLASAPGGVARPGTAAPGPLSPCPLACSPGARGGAPLPAGAVDAAGRVKPQAARATEICLQGKPWGS